MVEKEAKKSSAANIIIWLLIILFVGSAVIGFTLGTIAMVVDVEHYRRVYQNPLTVDAVVSDYDDYDDEGDTDYKSYITYTVNGVRYSNIEFEDKDTKDKLTPIGQTVTVQVSPEDPSVLIKKLESSGRFLIFLTPIMLFFVAAGWRVAVHNRRTKHLYGTPDQQAICTDAQLTVVGRKRNVFWLLTAVAYVILYQRYSMVIWQGVLLLAAISTAVWLWCVWKACRQLSCIRNADYALRQDTLVWKEYIPDSDGDSYRLHYQSGEYTWSRDVTKHYYDKAKEGSVVLAMYLPSEKKPVFHYDLDGDAC